MGIRKEQTTTRNYYKNWWKNDVEHGNGMVLPLDKLEEIPGVLVAPMNTMNQDTIDEHGRIIRKDRLTHDQNYEWGAGTSVNNRVKKENVLPCKFGACIKRLLH